MIRQILNPLSGQFDQVGTAFLADLPNIAASRILGRVTAGSGTPEELTIAQVLALGGLATSITATKTLTLASEDSYTLTAEATGIVALLNRSGGQTFTTAQTISTTTANNLFLNTPADIQTGLGFQSAGVTKGVIFRPANTNSLVIYNDAYAIRVENSTGYVGIGNTTNSPTSTLTVFSPIGGINTGITLKQIANNPFASASYESIDFSSTGGLIGQFFSTATNYSNAAVNLSNNSVGLLAESASGQLLLGAAGASGYISINAGGYAAAYERIRITSAGLVGIGTSSPLALMHLSNASATTNATVEVLRIENTVTSTGVGEAGLGAAADFYLETATNTTNRQAARIAAVWTEATNATRKADLVFSAFDTAEREGFRIKANGSAALNYLGGNTYLQADSRKLYWGAGDDMSVYYDGTDGYIKTDEVAASDLHITCGTAKTLVLDTPVTTDMQWEISSGRVGVANFPDWRTLTTNTADYAFDVDDYIDLNAEEVPHSWVEGGTVDIHLHVATDAANSSGSSQYAKFTVYIAYSEAGTAWAETSFTAELEIPNGTAANTPFYLDMGNLDLTGFSIGAHVKPRVKRIAATGGTEYADHIFIHQAGGHVLNDTLGSRQEGTK